MKIDIADSELQEIQNNWNNLLELSHVLNKVDTLEDVDLSKFEDMFKHACSYATHVYCMKVWEGKEKRNTEGVDWRKEACLEDCPTTFCMHKNHNLHKYLTDLFRGITDKDLEAVREAMANLIDVKPMDHTEEEWGNK